MSFNDLLIWLATQPRQDQSNQLLNKHYAKNFGFELQSLRCRHQAQTKDYTQMMD